MGRRTEFAIVIIPVAICLSGYALLSAPTHADLLVSQNPAPRALAAASASRVAGSTANSGTPSPPPASVESAATVVLLASTAASDQRTESPPLQPPSPATSDAPPAFNPLQRGRELTALLYAQQLSDLWSSFRPSVQREWAGLPSFREYRAGGLNTYGNETRVLAENVLQDGNISYYTRTATFERGPDAGWTLIFGLDPQGRVVDFGIVAAGAVPTRGGS